MPPLVELSVPLEVPAEGVLLLEDDVLSLEPDEPDDPVAPVDDEGLPGVVDDMPPAFPEELLVLGELDEEVELPGLRSHALMLSAVTTARGIIHAFMMAPVAVVETPKWIRRSYPSVR